MGTLASWWSPRGLLPWHRSGTGTDGTRAEPHRLARTGLQSHFGCLVKPDPFLERVVDMRPRGLLGGIGVVSADRRNDGLVFLDRLRPSLRYAQGGSSQKDQ